MTPTNWREKWDEAILAILPVLGTNLTDDSKMRQIKEITDKALTPLLVSLKDEVGKERGKYPTDIWSPPPTGWQDELDEWCKTQGYRIDKISGEYGRRYEQIYLTKVEDLLQRAIDGK